MSNLNADPAPPPNDKALPARVLAALGMAGLGALVAVLALTFLPPNFVAQLLGPGIPSANASNPGSRNAALEARRHRHADALIAQHGTYVSDPYGCLYMFQYLNATLSLVPVRDENQRQVCTP
jgi:hypothetical protein